MATSAHDDEGNLLVSGYCCIKATHFSLDDVAAKHRYIEIR